MSTKARCKFRCASVTDFGSGQKSVKLIAVSKDGVPENEAFSQYTPSGTIDVSITNPAVLPMFEPGREFYVDLIPVE